MKGFYLSRLRSFQVGKDRAVKCSAISEANSPILCLRRAGLMGLVLGSMVLDPEFIITFMTLVVKGVASDEGGKEAESRRGTGTIAGPSESPS